jgi:hypothetical protein
MGFFKLRRQPQEIAVRAQPSDELHAQGKPGVCPM